MIRMNTNNLEIEKKYLVNNLDDVKKEVGIEKCKKIKIEQGYLSNNPTIRVRKYNDEYCITYKSRLVSDTSDLKNNYDVIVNREVELPLTKESYEHMLTKIDDNLVSKVRYNIELAGGLIAELDVFEGKLDGLIMVEVEFESEESARNFVKPQWFGEDVSSDIRYKNLFLSKLDSIHLL